VHFYVHSNLSYVSDASAPGRLQFLEKKDEFLQRPLPQNASRPFRRNLPLLRRNLSFNVGFLPPKLKYPNKRTQSPQTAIEPPAAHPESPPNLALSR
jgi:hypothetical protein